MTATNVKKSSAASKRKRPKTVSGNASRNGRNQGTGKNDSGFQNFKTMEKVMTKSKNKFDQFTQSATSAGRENVEAFVQSGNVFARGFEDLLRTYVSWAQESAEKNSQAFKDLLSCKTLNEFTETQNRVARENFDDFMSGVSRISELSVKVSTEALEPINDQFSKTIKRAGEAAAA